MLRRTVIWSALAVLAVGTVGAEAQSRLRNPVPFSHEPCSVFDEGPCPPTCGLFEDGPCIPEIYYPYGQDLRLTVLAVPPDNELSKYKRPDHDLDTISDLFAALRACWAPPVSDHAKDGMQMTVRFSFKRTGEMIGPPRLTFATPGVPSDTRETYLKAINESLTACLPLKFTSGLAGALVGRPIAIRYVDNREQGKGADKP